MCRYVHEAGGGGGITLVLLSSRLADFGCPGTRVGVYGPGCVSRACPTCWGTHLFCGPRVVKSIAGLNQLRVVMNAWRSEGWAGKALLGPHLFSARLGVDLSLVRGGGLMAKFLSLEGRVRSVLDGQRLVQPQLRRWWPQGCPTVVDVDRNNFWFHFPDNPSLTYRMSFALFGDCREVVRVPDLGSIAC